MWTSNTISVYTPSQPVWTCCDAIQVTPSRVSVSRHNTVKVNIQFSCYLKPDGDACYVDTEDSTHQCLQSTVKWGVFVKKKMDLYQVHRTTAGIFYVRTLLSHPWVSKRINHYNTASKKSAALSLNRYTLRFLSQDHRSTQMQCEWHLTPTFLLATGHKTISEC